MTSISEINSDYFFRGIYAIKDFLFRFNWSLR